jgi:hypothetical protein
LEGLNPRSVVPGSTIAEGRWVAGGSVVVTGEWRQVLKCRICSAKAAMDRGSMNANSASRGDEDLVVELYKSLRAEASNYIEKVPALWLQKFILIGLMLAFLLTRKGSLNFTGKGSGVELGFDAALIGIALLACFLDAKILEYGLHARAISTFIEEEFAHVRILPEWEKTLWGYGSNNFSRGIIRIRSATTVFVTVFPTVLVIILVSIVIYIRREVVMVLVSGLLISFAYIIATLIVWRRVWPSETKFQSTEQAQKVRGHES